MKDDPIRKLAEEGDADAQAILGAIYLRGSGVPQDYKKAENWLHKAALQGDAAAQSLLAGLYFEGKDLPLDYTKAAHWYRKAAMQGKADCQWLLAMMHSEGFGLPKNQTKAHAWMNLAAAQGDKQAVRDRDKLERQMTPEQITQAQALAAKLHKRIEARTRKR